MDKQYKNGLIEKSSISEDKRELTVVITEESLDLDGEVVITKGVNFKDFLTNGAIIFSHNAELVLAKPLEIKRVGKRILLKMKFPEAGKIKRDRANPDDIWELIKLGAIQSLSIGFFNIEPPRTPSKLDIQNFGKGVNRVLHKTRLIEASFVAIPSNRGTEILAMKKLDINPKTILGDDYVEIKTFEQETKQELLVKQIKEQINKDNKQREIIDTIKEGLIKEELFKKGIVVY